MATTESIVPKWNSGLKGNNRGNATMPTSWIPSKCTMPIKQANTYPTTRPTSTESERRKPRASTWHTRHTSRVTLPTIQFSAEPKSEAPCPPAKLLAPMGSSDTPMAVTTVAATTGEMSFIQYLAHRPSTPSIRPPTITAPMSEPIPCVVAMVIARLRKVKLMPITTGRREPMRHTG